jgi:hypothetical protein
MISKQSDPPAVVANSGTVVSTEPAKEAVAASTDKASAIDENAIEVKAMQPQFDIAKEGSELKKLPKMFSDMKDKFKNAADKVWTGGDEKKADNFIQKTGLDWMNSVQKFRHTAGEMRKHAEDVYDDIVKSHTVAAKKQMRTFKEEMAKLKKVHEEHERIADEAKKVDAPVVPEANSESGAAKKPVATETQQESGEKPLTEAEKKKQADEACAEVKDTHCRTPSGFEKKRHKYSVPEDYTCITMYKCTKVGNEDFGPVTNMGECQTKGFSAQKTGCGAQKL